MRQVSNDPVPAPDGAHGRLRTLLLTGELSAGAPLKEIELADRLGISRTPVREALHRLEVEGVVEKVGRSYRVAEMDADAAADVAQARSVIEPAIAALAAEAVAGGRIAPVALAEVEASVAALRAAAEAQDGPAAAVANHAFHSALAGLVGNEVLVEMAMRLNDRLAVASLARLGSPDWASEAARQHAAIAERVAAGDADGARAAAVDHVDSVGRRPERQ